MKKRKIKRLEKLTNEKYNKVIIPDCYEEIEENQDIKYKKNTEEMSYSNNKINNNSNTNFTSNTNRNQEETNNYTKSYFRRKNYKNLTNIFSPIKKSQNKENNKIKVTKTRLNKSAERRHNLNDGRGRCIKKGR